MARAYNRIEGNRLFALTMARRNLLSLFYDFSNWGKGVAVAQRRGYCHASTTYAELAARARLWSLALASREIGPGERVLLWGQNSADWVAGFWAILLRGAIVVPMDGGANLDFVQRTIHEADVKLVLHDSSLMMPPAMGPSASFENLAAVAPGVASRKEVHPFPGDVSTRETIAEILFTSGTTAEPRGVVLTHGNFLANLEPLEQAIEPYLKYERWLHPLCFVSLVPLSHVFGQFMTLFVPPLMGAKVVFEPSSQHGEVIRTVKRERATALIAVPRMLDVLRNGLQREIQDKGKPERFKKKFEKAASEKFLRRAWSFRHLHGRFGWKFWAFISGGAALSNETETFFRRLGYAVVQGYGMTETASLISLNHPFHSTEGSVGKILPGREFKLAEDGEILVRGESITTGYWEKGQVKPSEENGWLRTGDLGELDAGGNLRFRGRKKTVIVTPAGLNVYPEDLEAALRKQPGIRDCAVVPMEKGGNAEPCAVILPAFHDGAKVQAALDAANATLAEYQRMRMWVLWPDPDFPRTLSGKPRVGLIASRAAKIITAAAKRETLTDASPDSLAALLSRFTLHATASPQAPLSSLSSLERVELLSVIEQHYKVELDEAAFAEAQTLPDIQRLLEAPGAARTELAYPRWSQRAPVRWFRLLIYYALAWPATQILAHPRVLGRENLKNVQGPVIVISNHVTRRADLGLILAALPARLRHRLAVAMGGENLQKMRWPPKEWFFAKRVAYQIGYFLVAALFNVFPLPKFSGVRESFHFAGESVDRGYSLLVFPEGVVNNSEDGRMAPFQSGIGLLTQNLDIPVVPMRLDGVWQMKRQQRRFAHFGEVVVRIGSPVIFPSEATQVEIVQTLEQRIRAL